MGRKIGENKSKINLSLVLLTSHSFQAPYVPVEVQSLKDVVVLSCLLMEWVPIKCVVD